MSLRLVAAPAADLITVADCKPSLRIDAADDTRDAEIEAYRLTAIARLDAGKSVLNRALLTQTWDWVIDALPDGDRALRLPLPPCQSVTSVTYVDTAGDSQTLTSYRTFGLGDPYGARLKPAYGVTWPATRDEPDAVTIRFVAGYGDLAPAVPRPIRQAAIGHVVALFDNQGLDASVPEWCEALLAPYVAARV